MYLFFKSLLILLIWPVPVKAQEKDATLSCPAIEDHRIYKGSKKSYKYLIEGQDHWFFRSKKDFKEDFTLTEKTLQRFVHFNQALKNKGMTLHILMPPTRGIIHADKLNNGQAETLNFNRKKAATSYLQSLEQLREKGLSVASFDALIKGGITENFFYPRDHHWTSHGARVAAQKTAQRIKPFKDDFVSTPFITEKTNEVVELDGSFEAFIEEHCGQEIEGAQAHIVKTYKAESDLFGEGSTATIALIGTSNCTEPEPSYANFAGHLREALSADVDNLSIGGAGIYTPMLAFLASEAYADNQYKHIVWELAAHYNFNGRDFSRALDQMIAAAQVVCEGQALQNISASISEQEKVDLPLKDFKTPSYLAIRYDQPFSKDFALSYRDDAGKSNRFRFERHERYPHDGLYFLQLPSTSVTLSDFTLYLDSEHGASQVKISVCPSTLD